MADMAAAWTGCTKLLFAKKSGASEKSGALLFCGVFWGCFGKSGFLRVVFCGEIVVNCVVNRGGLMVGFWGLKIHHSNLNFSVENWGQAKSRSSRCAEG